ncbi:MAG: uracil-DNA glycosylase [Planctomycetota bacterium]
MSVDRAWRQRIEALRRAGLDYISRDRLANLVATENPASASSIEIATPRVVSVPSAVKEPYSAPLAEPAPPLVRVVESKEAVMAKRKTSPLSTGDKEAALKVLSGEVSACTLCSTLARSRTQTVFSDGSSTAELCFVGEAPGADEDREGVPFVGRAGQLLTKIIEACKLRRDEVYICNVLKCRPPENRNPTPDEISNCRPFLERQLAIVQPKMLVALGKFAAAHLLQKAPEQVPIMKMRGEIHEYCGIPFMITLHPAYLLRNPNAKKDVWEDMKTVMRAIGRPVD